LDIGVHIIESFVRMYWKEIAFGSSITGVVIILSTRYFEMAIKWLTRYFARKKYAKKQLEICLEKIITDWEDYIKSETLEKERDIRRNKLQDNGIKLKEVVADNEEYHSGETVKEALDIAREIKETSTLNILTFSVSKPHDEQPNVIFKERGGRVVERAKGLIKRL